mgnify:CR=1 FL=1
MENPGEGANSAALISRLLFSGFWLLSFFVIGFYRIIGLFSGLLFDGFRESEMEKNSSLQDNLRQLLFWPLLCFSLDIPPLFLLPCTPPRVASL